MPFFPEQKGNDSLPLKTVSSAIALMVFLTCVFLQVQGYGVFDWVGRAGLAILGVLDELWKQP